MTTALHHRLTPTQQKIRGRHLAFKARIARQARPDTGIECASVSALVHPAPEPAEPEPSLSEQLRLWRERQFSIPIPVRSVVEQLFPEPVSVRLIQGVVAHKYNISMMDMLSARRMKDIVRPRQIAMYEAKEMTSFTLPALGRHFGYRDHTTILHAVRKIQALRLKDIDLADELSSIEVEIMEAHKARQAHVEGIARDLGGDLG